MAKKVHGRMLSTLTKQNSNRFIKSLMEITSYLIQQFFKILCQIQNLHLQGIQLSEFQLYTRFILAIACLATYCIISFQLDRRSSAYHRHHTITPSKANIFQRMQYLNLIIFLSYDAIIYSTLDYCSWRHNNFIEIGTPNPSNNIQQDFDFSLCP